MFRKRILALLVVVTLVAVACGSDGDDESTAAEGTETPTPTEEPTAEATDEPTPEPTSETPEPTTEPTAEPTPEPTPESPDLTLTLTGLTHLENDFHYEGWAIVDGNPVSTGKFNIEDGAIVSLDMQAMDGFEVAGIEAASAIVITIEPDGDSDAVPAETHILAGDVVDGTATLSIAHPAALGTDFGTVSGELVLATPSTDTTSDELSGIWFLTLPGPEPSLVIPELPPGWNYEGWAVIDGTPVTSGTFRSAVGADDAAPYGGPGRMPGFPGEDFIANAPEGLTFPTDLSGRTVVVSVEPFPDDSPAPFVLKPLAGELPVPSHEEPVSYPLQQNLVDLPGGTAVVG